MLTPLSLLIRINDVITATIVWPDRVGQQLLIVHCNLRNHAENYSKSMDVSFKSFSHSCQKSLIHSQSLLRTENSFLWWQQTRQQSFKCEAWAHLFSLKQHSNRAFSQPLLPLCRSRQNNKKAAKKWYSNSQQNLQLPVHHVDQKPATTVHIQGVKSTIIYSLVQCTKPRKKILKCNGRELQKLLIALEWHNIRDKLYINCESPCSKQSITKPDKNMISEVLGFKESSETSSWKLCQPELCKHSTTLEMQEQIQSSTSDYAILRRKPNLERWQLSVKFSFGSFCISQLFCRGQNPNQTRLSYQNMPQLFVLKLKVRLKLKL